MFFSILREIGGMQYEPFRSNMCNNASIFLCILLYSPVFPCMPPDTPVRTCMPLFQYNKENAQLSHIFNIKKKALIIDPLE